MEGAAAQIVIVEDDEGVARLQQKRLQRAGYRAQTFARPEEASAYIQQHAVDLMILDYRLPDQRTGLDFYEDLKQRGHDIPAILVTGFANEAMIITALRAGMKDFVSKSAEYLDYLPEAVGRVLRQSQIERRLAETEARFETVFRSSPIGIAIQDMQSARFLDANDAYLKLLACPRQKLIGATAIELGIRATGIDRRQFLDRLEQEGSISKLEIAITNCAGAEIVMEIAAEAIDLHGSSCLLIMAQDITQRRQVEELSRLQDRAMNAVGEGILIADAEAEDCPLVYANHAFEQLTGYAAAEVYGRNCRFLQGPDSDRAVVADLRAAIQQGHAKVVEILNYRKDGTTFWNLLSVTPVLDDEGKITHFVGVQRDVTESKLVAEQLRQSQKMEAIGRLAGGVAHDFNNILTIMLGNTELALEDLDANRDCRDLLQEILQAGRRAAGLTRQLLAFSRRQVLEPRVLDLNAIVTESQKMLKRLIGEDILLSTSLHPHLRKIKADPVQLEQILLNMTVNARDAMPKGGKLIIETDNVDLDPSHVLTAGEIRPGPYVMLVISDTGAGMNEAIKSRIFEPFFTTKERGRGTGLGLATVYGIVQQSGGYIWVYSEPNHGTTFKIFLPEHAAAGAAPARKAAPRSELRGNETLMIVEDERQVCAIARRMLEAQGYRVLEASSGQEALALVRDFAEPIDLLITDVIMPGMSGKELADAFIAARPKARVLFISGYTDNTILEHGVLEEGVAFVQKPFSQESLAMKVRQVLDA
jgi:PAS domain S-box-containing protein